MALDRYVLPVKARPVVPSVIHSFTSVQPLGRTGCAHFDEGVETALVEVDVDGSSDVDVGMVSLVVDSTSLVSLATLELVSSLGVGEAADVGTVSLVVETTSPVVVATVEVVSSLDVGTALEDACTSLDVVVPIEVVGRALDEVETMGSVCESLDDASTVEGEEVLIGYDVDATKLCVEEAPFELETLVEATLVAGEEAAIVADETAVVDVEEIERETTGEEEIKAELALKVTEVETAPEEVAARLEDAREAEAVLALVGTADDTGIEGDEDGRDDVALVELATADALLDATTGCDRNTVSPYQGISILDLLNCLQGVRNLLRQTPQTMRQCFL